MIDNSTDNTLVLLGFCALFSLVLNIVILLITIHITCRIHDIEEMIVKESLVHQLVKKEIVTLPNNFKIKEQ